MHQRQTRTHLFTTIPQLAQCTKRCFLLPRQYQACVCLNGKAAGRGVVGITNAHQPRLLQIAQHTVVAFVNRFGRHAVTLLACTHQEVHDVSRQPVLFRAVFIPQAKATVILLHLQQTRNADIHGSAPLVIAIADNTQRFQLLSIGIKLREESAGGLLQTTVWIGFQFTNITRQIQRRFATQQELPLQRGR